MMQRTGEMTVKQSASNRVATNRALPPEASAWAAASALAERCHCLGTVTEIDPRGDRTRTGVLGLPHHTRIRQHGEHPPIGKQMSDAQLQDDVPTFARSTLLPHVCKEHPSTTRLQGAPFYPYTLIDSQNCPLKCGHLSAY
jgi:hypothetical protein